MISIIIPTHTFPNSEFYLNRLLDSIRIQSFQDYEIIIKKTGKGMAHNCNKGIQEATGDLIKFMCTDDYFADKDALKRIVEAQEGYWMINGCSDNNHPYFTEDIYLGNNKLGSPSCLTIKNKNVPKFDENLAWLLDCDYYKKLYDLHGEPQILDEVLVVMGKHDNQETNVLSDERKQQEYEYLKDLFA